METFLFVLVILLASYAYRSSCMPITNGTNTTYSLNVSEVQSTVREEKEDGPSDILFPVCSGYLGVNNRMVIKDDQMFASSNHDTSKMLKLVNTSLEDTSQNATENSTVTGTNSSYTIKGNLTAAHDGRLGNADGSWCASEDGYDGEQHLVIDLGHVKIIEGVITQGRPDSDNWVTEYMVSHSSDKSKWYPIQKNGQNGLFKGNKDRNSFAVGSFPNRIAARFIKFIPKSNHGTFMCMRVEAVGCDPDAVNVAKDQPTEQSSTKRNFTSSKAVDGDFVHDLPNDTCSHTHRENFPWLRIDLRRIYQVKEIIISNHGHRAGRDLRDFEVRVGNSLENEGNNNALCSSLQTVHPGQIKTVVCQNGTFGRFVNIRIPREDSTLGLCEVAVLGIAETIVKLGLEDIAESLQTGSVTDKTGEVNDIPGGLLGQMGGMLGTGLLNQLPGQGLGMLSNLQGQGLGMLNNLKGQGMGMFNNLKGQGLGMVNKLKGQGLEMANKLKGQGLKMANKLKGQGLEMANKLKGQGLEMANKLKGQGMEMANKLKGQSMELAKDLQGQGMGMAKDLQKQGMGVVTDMQGQMNQQQDKFKKKLKEILKKAKEYLNMGKEEMEKFKKKGYIETGKRYLDDGLAMTMKGISYIQAKLMESMGSIASDMTQQITTFSEYDASDVKGLLDDVDPVSVREFVQEARPKISGYIEEMERLGMKYFKLGLEKAIEAKDEIEKEADSASKQATDLGKNVAGKATSVGKNMANKAKAVGMKAANKAKSVGMSAVNKAKIAGMDAMNKAKAAGMKALNKAKEAGMDALNKAKSAGMGAFNNLKQTGMGALSNAKGLGMGALGQLKQTGMGALGQAQGLGMGMFGKLSGAGRKLFKQAKTMKSSRMKQLQQIQMLQQLKLMKKMRELQKKLESEQDEQWKKFELLSKEAEELQSCS